MVQRERLHRDDAFTFNMIMPGTISDSIWDSITNSIIEGNLPDVIKRFSENSLDHKAKGGLFEKTVLHFAVREGNYDIVKYFIEQSSASLDSKDKNGITPLLEAARMNKVKEARLLINHRADVNTKNNASDTPLLEAVGKNNLKLAQLFIDNGADTNSVDDAGITPLLRTAIHDHVVLAQLLLKHGADINSKSLVGYTPLWVAANKNHVKIARLFLKHEADVVIPLFRAARENNIQVVQFFIDLGADVDKRDGDGNTPLLIAAQRNHEEVARLFVSHGADVTVPLFYAARKNNIEVVNLLTELEVDIDAKNNDGDTPLWIAAQMNHLEVTRILFNHGADVVTLLIRAVRENNVGVVQRLLELGAHVDSKDKVGDTLLWMAAQKNYKEIAKLLYSHGADVFTLLIRAVQESNVEVVEILIELGADVETKDSGGNTLICLAADKKDLEVVKFLIKNRANVADLLLRAARDDDVRLVQFLIKAGAKIEAKDYDGDTPLWIAAQNNRVEVARVLFNHGAGVATLLFRAAHENNLKIVKLLIKLGATVDCKDSVGDTPLWKAAQKNHVEVARVLFNHGADVATLLFRAAHESNLKLVQLFIELGAQLECMDADGDTPLIKAAKNKLVGVVQILLQKEADISVRDKTGLSTINHIQQNMSSDDIKDVFRVSPKVWKLSDPAGIIEDLQIKEEYEVNTRNILSSLLNQAIDELPSVIDDPKQRFVFYRGNLFSRLITTFLERKGDDTDLLKTIYIALQAKVECNQAKKDVLIKIIDKKLYDRFLERMKHLAEDPYSAIVSKDLKTIAEQIYSDYLKRKEKKETGCCFEMRSFFKNKAEKLKSCCQSIRSKVGHNCKAQGKMAFILCTLGIGFYLLDLYTDIVVGIEDYNGFSQKLGIFELFIVAFTLCHENYRSSISLYATRKELLRITLGRSEIKAKDWKESELNWSEKRWVRVFYMMFCPFRVQGTSGKLKKLKILYNICTFFQLRPVVDRMLVLFHPQTTLRKFYRVQAEQNCLKQFYLILEQLPQLLAQFYTFQILYNNLTSSEIQNTDDVIDCDQYFDYHRFNSSNTNDTNSFCNILSLPDDRLRVCSTTFRIISMLIPFYNIPSGIASLENGFRRLDPLTPKMSTAQKIIFQVSYMLMIPARVVMFATVMHALSNKEYVFGYIIIRTILEFFFNLHSVHNYILHLLKGSLVKMASTWWRLCLFSFRDVFVISIRDPVAYLSKPSDVSYGSLRKWKNFAVRAMLCVCEGLMGALLIEQRYPCGKYSESFKYFGWYCLILLVVSSSALVMMSDLFHPVKIRSTSSSNYLKKALFTLMISGIGVLAFSRSQTRSSTELFSMCMFILLHILVNAGLIIFIKMSGSKNIAADGETIKPRPVGTEEVIPLLNRSSSNSIRNTVIELPFNESEQITPTSDSMC